MIRCIQGPPRAGKTMLTMRLMAASLRFTKKWIVTSITEIDFPRFQRWFAESYPGEDIDLSRRIQFIPKTESRRWYRYRGSYTLPVFEYDPKSGELPEELDKRMQDYFAEVHKHSEDCGVEYFIDECHRYFCAEEYAQFARIARFYLTQHGHLDDMFWWTTQNPEQVVIQVRRLTQDTHVIRNQALETFLFWAKPKRFVWSLYARCPESKERGLTPMETGSFRLDKAGLAACYRTRGALGGMSPIAETPPVRRKLPFWTIYAGGAVVVVLGVLLIALLPQIARKVLQRFVGGVMDGVHPVERVEVKPQTSKPAGSEPARYALVVGPAERGTVVSQVERHAVNYATSGKGVRIALDDGTMLTEDDVLAYTRHEVITRGGERIPFDLRAKGGGGRGSMAVVGSPSPVSAGRRSAPSTGSPSPDVAGASGAMRARNEPARPGASLVRR